MIKIFQNNNIYEIKSKYDPDFIALIKTIPGRRWDVDRKVWSIPSERLGFLINACSNTVYADQLSIHSNEDLGQNATLDATAAIPQVDISNVETYVEAGSHLYAHQIDTLRYMIYRHSIGCKSGFLLADEPGLGKTLSVMNAALYKKNHEGAKHCLVICCINTSKYNWYDDIVRHSNGEYTPYILGSRRRKRGEGTIIGSSKDKLADLETMRAYTTDDMPYFMILNVEALRYRQGKYYPIADAIIRLINSGQLNMIAVDEIHKNCGQTSQQGKQLLKIKLKSSSNCEWIPMTGTPIVTSPLDCFLPMRLIDATDIDSYYIWSQHFCVYGGFGGHEVVGYKNIPELKQIVQSNMLRRLKRDVLDLPEKISVTEYVENTPCQNKLYSEIREDLRKRKRDPMQLPNLLAMLMKLRQVNGYPEVVNSEVDYTSNTYIKQNAKLQRMLELVDMYCSKNQKVVIFSNWVQPLRMLYYWIAKKYKTCVFTGTMKPDIRNKNKKVFEANPDYLVMLGTIGALGTAHTLTASHVIIFYDEPWTAADKEQAEDRCHRISMKDTLMIHTLITKGTIDERVHNIVYAKGAVSKYIIDNNMDICNNLDLLDKLLED